MLSADQVPVNNSHSRMQWPKWVVLIAGSTGSALRAVRPPNLRITPWYSARSRLIGAMPCQDHSIKIQDLLFEAEQLAAPRGKACTHYIGHPFVARIGNDT